MNYNIEITIAPQKIVASKRHYFLVLFLAFFLPVCVSAAFWLSFYPRDAVPEQNISFIVYALLFSVLLLVLVVFSLYLFIKRSRSNQGGDHTPSSNTLSKNSNDNKTQSFLIIVSSKQYYFGIFITACVFLWAGALIAQNFYYVAQNSFGGGDGFFSYIKKILDIPSRRTSYVEVVIKVVIQTIILFFVSVLLLVFIKDGYT